jgi:hypothetical protein
MQKTVIFKYNVCSSAHHILPSRRQTTTTKPKSKKKWLAYHAKRGKRDDPSDVSIPEIGRHHLLRYDQLWSLVRIHPLNDAFHLIHDTVVKILTLSMIIKREKCSVRRTLELVPA